MKKKTVMILVVALVAAAATVAPCCSIFTEYRQVEEMSDAQFDAYQARLEAWTNLAAMALIEEEVLSAEEAVAVADVVASVSSGSFTVGAAGVLVGELKASGWQRAALVAAFGELDGMLERAAFWDEFTPRRGELIQSIADAIRAAAEASEAEGPGEAEGVGEDGGEGSSMPTEPPTDGEGSDE